MTKENIMNTYGRFDITFNQGKGSFLYDINGKEYLDFVAGIAVNCLGHCHPKIVDTIKNQSEKLIHISNLYWNSEQIKLAELLSKYSDHNEVFFNNSGTEACETALKLARKYGYTKEDSTKNIILYMENSFHGRTMGALSVTGQEKYQEKFKPLISGVEQVKFNDIKDLTEKMNKNVCAIIVEPIQGEGGIIPAHKEFLYAARQLCNDYDALLIFDEVQCGVGRTGKLFAYQNFGIVPDVICMAKGLGAGYPIGAVLANTKAASAFEPGDHGCTFGGSPLACAVSIAVLDELINKSIINDVNKKSDYLIDKINELKNSYKMIERVNGLGLMLGIQFNESVNTKDIVNRCFKEGLLLVGAGNNVIRLVPPLTVKYNEIDQAMSILEKVLKFI